MSDWRVGYLGKTSAVTLEKNGPTSKKKDTENAQPDPRFKRRYLIIMRDAAVSQPSKVKKVNTRMPTNLSHLKT